jgi:ubiquinone/menaquinone biosynthesis C-methylase UbiE
MLWSRCIEIVSGSLNCPKCNSLYPIIDGLPVILEEADKISRTQKGFGKQWTLQKMGYFEKDLIYGTNAEEELQCFKDVFELSDLIDLSGMLILDAGCGSGRLTESIGKAAKNSIVVGFDISDSAKVALNRCKEVENVHIVQCNLLYPPFNSHSFDYIWSEGVIHHTPNSLQSFERLDRLLTKNGKLYIWIYPNYKFSSSRFVRDILWKPYLLPSSVLYLISWLLAVPLYCCNKILQLAKVHKKTNLKGLVFQFYDSLVPEFQHRHSKEEVRGWFVSHGYREIKFIGDIGALGKK